MRINICKNIFSLIISMTLANLFIYIIGYYKSRKNKYIA